MPLFSKGKPKSGHFVFNLRVHELTPFPSRFSSTSIVWNRGSKKGSLRAVQGTQLGSTREVSRFIWNEDIPIDCTLSFDQGSPGHGSGFEKKWLILNIVDGQNVKAKEPCGRVVINLADYATQEDPEPISFTVALSKAICEVKESKLIISIQGQEAGKSSRNGKSILDSSRASSEMSEDVDSRSPSMTHSVPLGRIPEDPPSHRRTEYDEDGFMVDEQPPQARSTATRANFGGSGRQPVPPAESDGNSDADSDEYLAQAAAAMDSKGAMPTLDGPSSRRNTREASANSEPTQQRGLPPQGQGNNPFVDSRRGTGGNSENFPPSRRPGAPLFALRPEGASEKPTPPSRNESLQSQGSTLSSRGSRQKLASDVPILSRPEKTIHHGNSIGSTIGSISSVKLEHRPRLDPSKSSIFADPPSSTSEAQTNPFLSDRTLPPVSGTSDRFGNTPLPDALPDRPVRRGSNRQLASLRTLNADSSSNLDSPKPEAERDRRKEVVLPKTVAVRKKAVISVPAEDVEASSSPVKASAPGRHWLDEPEDLGVEASPPASPRVSAMPAFERVSPVFKPPATTRAGKNANPMMFEGPGGLDSKSVSNSSFLGSQQSSSPTKESSEPHRFAVERPVDPGQPVSPFGEKPRSPTKRALRPEAPAAKSAEAAPPRGFPTPAPAVVPPPRNEGVRSRAPAGPKDPAPQGPPALRSQPEAPRVFQQEPPARPVFAPDPYPTSDRGFNPLEKGAPSQQNASFDRPQGEPARTIPVTSHALETAQPVPSTSPQAGTINGGVGSEDEEQAAAMAQELRSVAALEASIYLVRGLRQRKHRISAKSRVIHAPARRLARTIISLGQEDGTIFGLRALRAMEAAADASSDIPGQAYWWSNCIQLRWMLWAVCHGGDPDEDDPAVEMDSDEFDWVLKVIMPPLRVLESEIFQQLFQHMWSCVLMESITADQLPGSASKTRSVQPSQQEEAVERWIDAFQFAHRALLPASNTVSQGHVNLLKHKILTALMRRLDSILFEILLEGGSGGGSFNIGSRMIATDWQGRNLSGLGRDFHVGEDLLPYELGSYLSVGVGVGLKMAAARWTTWAADIGLRNDQGSQEEGYMLFPKLRATASLLMMPKEVFTDRAIRAEVIPGLKLSQICELLSRFRPDDLSDQSLPPGLLEALHSETPTSGNQPESPTIQGKAGYEPPSEAALLASGLIDPVSLEFNDESEDELDAIAEMFDPEQMGHNSERFQLLRELWASAR